MKWIKGQKDLINLAAGDPDIRTPNFIIDHTCEALNAGFTHYTSYYGLNQSRNLISKKLEERNNVHYDPETEIIVVSGVQEGIYIAGQTFLYTTL